MKTSFFSGVAFAGLVLSLFLSSTAVNAAEQCPAINCDCSALSSESWVKTCEQHETRIKKACVANGNTPKDYCAVHGPKARPLPLSLELSEYQLDDSVKVSSVTEQRDSAAWAATSDVDAVIQAFDQKSYARVLKILKLIDGNTDKAFQLQLQVASLLDGEDEVRAHNNSWKKYSKAVKPTTEKLEAFGKRVSSKISAAGSAKEKKIYSVLSQKALRVAGKNYEHIGYGDGLSGRDSGAAKSWSKAAKIASSLAEINKSVGGKAEAIKFAEFQAAARLHRASFHWLKNESIGNSVAALKDSQGYLEHDAQKDVDSLITTEEEKKKESGLGGILSGR